MAADTLTKEARSELMSRIRGKDTSPEVAVRSTLHRRGFRFRLHRPDLPGRPDIVLPRYKVAIFVHGCFWHLHAGCRDGRIPKSNVEFWTRKLTGNKTRDEKNMAALAATGWRPIIVWECEIERYMDKVEKLLVAHILNKAT